MKPKHVTSLELSKRLKEAGFKQESEFMWTLWHNGVLEFEKPPIDFKGEYHLVSTPCYHDKDTEYAAFLATELLEWMGKASNGMMFDGEFWMWAFPTGLDIKDKTYPNALAKMLLYLAEQKIINPIKL